VRARFACRLLRAIALIVPAGDAATLTTALAQALSR